MPRETLDMLIDLPDRDRILEFLAKVAMLRGLYEFIARPRRLSLSQKQRGYYHGHVVEIFAEFLESTGQPLTEGFECWHDFAHAALKRRCLMIPVYGRDGGVADYVVGSTSMLNTAAMSEFTERCRKYLWDRFELMTQDPDPDWAVEAARQLERKTNVTVRMAERKALPEPRAAVA